MIQILRLELLPTAGREALHRFVAGARDAATIRGLRRHRLLVWERHQWRLSRLGLHAARHYGLGQLPAVEKRTT
jgi:hypothetical protein